MAIDVDQFQRAAAEIADQAVGLMDARHDAERGQLRFALAGQDLDIRAADALRLRDEFWAVLGIAACRGRDPEHAVDAQRVAERAKPQQCG